jgi:ParB family transcriptional regulator, chromosome partitioning protein
VAGVQDLQVRHRGHRCGWHRQGELRKVCTEPDCPVHHPKKQLSKVDASLKAEQESRRREEALANATGIRVLQTIVVAVPVRLMKRDLLFIAEQMLALLEEKRQEMVARNRGIKAKEGESTAKLLTAFVRTADEGAIGRVIVEAVILLSARTQPAGGKTLRAAAQAYKVDTDRGYPRVINRRECNSRMNYIAFDCGQKF